LEMKKTTLIVLMVVIVACSALASYMGYYYGHSTAKASLYVIGVEPVQPIEVKWLTPYEDVLAKPPKTATLILSNGSKVVAKLNRTYYYVPSSYDEMKPVPLVITLHGA